jgi:N-acetylmuramoyl-L-alanine amidase
MASTKTGSASTSDLDSPKSRFLSGLQRWFAIGLAAIVIGALIIVGAQNAPRWLAALAATPSASAIDTASATANPANLIGIVSGHRGNDSGTVCADGLTEAQVNFDHATRVADFLRAEGYMVDILDEFDPRLKGYRALALLSIHADSCAYINDLATGFKTARALESHVPETEDRFVACLISRYKRATGMRFHANTVTRDMTQYHAFGEIAPETPAAIIETGFMYLDRAMLTRKPEVVAKGVTEGVLCFLRNEEP